MSAAATPTVDRSAVREALYGDGIVACKQAFSMQWTDDMRADIERLFDEAIARPGGAVGRGPKRYYVEICPEQLRGFVDLATHPWVVAVCDEVLGPDYKIVELGFDIPFPGSMNQPWHRDFPSPVETTRDHRLTSLAFNLTAVDTLEEMGPFEIAVGTQWEDSAAFDYGMFPPKDGWDRYAERAQRKYPNRGDVSARSALTIHRGTASTESSPRSRPVLVMGVDAPGAGNDEHHDLQVTRRYLAELPDRVRQHLIYREVDELEPIVQKHTIEGLVMGEP